MYKRQAKRAAWAASRLFDKATEGTVALGELREGLGRLQFITGAIEYFRPFLGPLYAWAAAGPRFLRPKLPIMVVLIMFYLSKELKTMRAMPCVVRAAQLGEIFRVDAKAEGDTVAIGGWRSADGTKAADASWFSVSLTRSNAPWAFARGEPFRTIASLELLASLVGLMVLVPEGEGKGDAAGTLSLSCGTDNQGNSYLLDRMLTTKYPLAVVLMELAHQMRRRRLILRALWTPRLENKEADALTTLDFRHFSPGRRVEVDLAKLELGLLNTLFQKGEEYLAELDAAKEKVREKKAKQLKRGEEREDKRRRMLGPPGQSLAAW